MARGSNFLRQRRGELEHHGFFGERPSAYLTYSHLRLLADHRTGLAQVRVLEIARACGLSEKVVRADLAWLVNGDAVIGRPAYIERAAHGNQYHAPIWRIVKYETTQVPSPPKGESVKVPSPVGGESDRVLSPPTREGKQRSASNSNALTYPNKKEKKKEKNPSEVLPSFGGTTLTATLSQRRKDYVSNFVTFAVDVGLRYTWVPAVAAALATDPKSPDFLRFFALEKGVAGFAQARRKPNPTAADFLRYLRKRAAGIVKAECERGVIHDGECIVRPGTARYQRWIKKHVHDPIDNVHNLVSKEARK